MSHLDDDPRLDSNEGDDDETFLRMVRYFYEEKGDPERYCFWDEDRFAALRPAAHGAWRKLLLARTVCDLLMSKVEED